MPPVQSNPLKLVNFEIDEELFEEHFKEYSAKITEAHRKSFGTVEQCL